jgi:DNA repair/transcription protein MET18/MMS19
VLKSLGKLFLSGYIALAEGEKDPRNLMVAFTIVRVLLIEFDISEHVEVSHALNLSFNDE